MPDMRKNLITKTGMDRLKEELNQLWRVERPEVTKKVSWAASLGDRSENADYQYNKKRLREIDRRVRYLSRRVEELRVIDAVPDDKAKVFFGAWVEVENEQGDQRCFQIVGYDEIFDRKDAISVDSPMAVALLQKQQGDEVLVHTPDGQVLWYVNRISYTAADTGS
jgi:transcription elongation factor GreB